MAYALLTERATQQATVQGVAAAVAIGMGAKGVEILTVDDILATLDGHLTAESKSRPADQQIVLDALGVAHG